jgi:hypothetical protein
MGRTGNFGIMFDPNKAGDENLEFFKPKQEPEQRGFFVPKDLRETNYNPKNGVYPTISFYSFLTSFYERKKDANEAIAEVEAAKKIQ